MYILTSEDSIEFEETGKIIASVLGNKLHIISIPARVMVWLAMVEERIFTLFKRKPIVTKRNIEATIADRVYDISKARKDLHFSPEVSMKEGISRVIEWYTKAEII